MNELTPLPYLESNGIIPPIPFERYLPPGTKGILPAWLEQHVSPGSWVLEPIGASPTAIMEAVRAGYKVLTAINNPVSAFELTLLSQSPGADELHSVLSELAIQKKGNERLETHIKNLYLTRCASCGKEVTASAFLWNRSEPTPYARIYSCPSCGDSGEHPITTEDVERLAIIQRSDQLHRSRALERVPDGTKDARSHLVEILKIYSSRPLYALFTLINKVEGMSLDPQRRVLMDALLLSALDAGHNLWSTSETNERPRMLNTPAEYIEKNLWFALEEAVNLWAANPSPIPLTTWPDLPESAGICLYPGRMRDLVQQKSIVLPETVVCVVPRPNQAFWTLSTLWSSWLWGKENVNSLKNVLERQRFDWYWHANALQSAFSPAAHLSKPGSPFFCLICEPAAGFVAATAEACAASGLVLTGYSCRSETESIQLEWQTKSTNHEITKINLQKIIREAVHNVLNETGEPCHYLKLYTAVILALAHENAFPQTVQQLTYDTVTEIQNEINKIFNDRKFLLHLDTTAQEFESGTWWLTQADNCQISLSDRVEMELVNWLQKDNCIADHVLRNQINQRFNGFMTPSNELIIFCLSSYAGYDQNTLSWTLKTNEFSTKRKKDLAEMAEMIHTLGEKFNFQSSGENPIYWFTREEPDLPRYQICLSASALISRFLRSPYAEPIETIFIFPGSRSALLRFKIDHDANLRGQISGKWHFLKYRTVRQMANRSDISPDLWDLFIDSDPISLEEATQLSMFL